MIEQDGYLILYHFETFIYIYIEREREREREREEILASCPYLEA